MKGDVASLLGEYLPQEIVSYAPVRDALSLGVPPWQILVAYDVGVDLNYYEGLRRCGVSHESALELHHRGVDLCEYIWLLEQGVPTEVADIAAVNDSVMSDCVALSMCEVPWDFVLQGLNNGLALGTIEGEYYANEGSSLPEAN